MPAHGSARALASAWSLLSIHACGAVVSHQCICQWPCAAVGRLVDEELSIFGDAVAVAFRAELRRLGGVTLKLARHITADDLVTAKSWSGSQLAGSERHCPPKSACWWSWVSLVSMSRAPVVESYMGGTAACDAVLPCVRSNWRACRLRR